MAAGRLSLADFWGAWFGPTLVVPAAAGLSLRSHHTIIGNTYQYLLMVSIPFSFTVWYYHGRR